MNAVAEKTLFNSNELSLLVAKAKKGDNDAFKQLVTALTNTVSAIALAITKDVDDSRDVSQQVFIKMWQQLDKLNNNESMLPWLRQVTRYTAFNYLREQRTAKRQGIDDAQLESLLHQVCEQSAAHDEQLIKHQQKVLVRHLMDQLPDESREIVVLYYREGNNSKNVAHLLGLTESTVRKRLQRSRAFLKDKVLAQYGKVLLATSPVGLATLFSSVALTSAPVAASTFAYSATAKSSHWLSKLIYMLGGAAIGGLLAVIANTLAMNKIMQHIDNAHDMQQLKKIKFRSTLLIIITSVLFSISYIVSDGWLLPVTTYSFFIAGLIVHINAANQISYRNLTRLAETDDSAKNKLIRAKLFSKIGWLIGVGGGSVGLIYGLYSSGRMLQVF